MRPCLAHALLALGAAACSPSSDDAAPPPTEHPSATDYPSATLPFRARASTPPGDNGVHLYDGVEIGRSLFFRMASINGFVTEVTSMLAMPVALPDRIAVIYPPDDRPGIDVAYAGYAQPWERAPLLDVHPADIGTLDAVATVDGGLVAVFRPRSVSYPVTLVSWRPGTGAVVETVPAAPGAQPSGGTFGVERCPDLSVGVSPAGDTDVLYRDYVTNVGFRVVHARRPQGSALWTHRIVDTDRSPSHVPPPIGYANELGCKTRLAYDEKGLPRAILLDRVIPYSASDPLNPTMGDHNPDASGSTFFYGADERWHLGFDLVGSQRESYAGEFDIDAHPDGYLLGGPSFLEPHLWLLGMSFVFDAGHFENAIYQSGAAEDERDGGYLLHNPCGVVSILQLNDARPGQWYMGGHPGSCNYASRAPVMVREDYQAPGHGLLHLPVSAHGTRPYDATLCLRGDDELVVCQGAHRGDAPVDAALVATSPFSDDEVPALVSSDPSDGAVGVDPNLAEVVLRLDRALAADVSLAYDFADVSVGTDSPWPDHVELRNGNEVHVVLQAPLEPGHLLRLAVVPTRAGAPVRDWQYVGGRKPPVVTFRTQPSAPAPADPRDASFAMVCDPPSYGRDPDGVCRFLPLVDTGAPNMVQLPQALIDPNILFPRVPIVTVAGVEVSDFTYHAPNLLTWSAALPAATEYLVTFPDDTVDRYGVAFPPEDRRARFATKP
ncbi:MAG: hypothetical protein IT373_14680 [Polyangiaceae bacterium]|nr:hypothetical protein [Polyangiaceae bacterium]